MLERRLLVGQTIPALPRGSFPRVALLTDPTSPKQVLCTYAPRIDSPRNACRTWQAGRRSDTGPRAYSMASLSPCLWHLVTSSSTDSHALFVELGFNPTRAQIPDSQAPVLSTFWPSHFQRGLGAQYLYRTRQRRTAPAPCRDQEAACSIK